MSEHNKHVERHLIEQVWNGGDFSVVDELVARDYIGHSTNPEDETIGRAGYRAYYKSLRQAFPNLKFEVEDQIAEGDRVVTRWTARGTHLGSFRGIPPTRKSGTISGITIERVAGGKVVECWSNIDDLGLLRQLGALPELRQTA